MKRFNRTAVFILCAALSLTMFPVSAAAHGGHNSYGHGHRPLTGWQTVDGCKYYYDSSGSAVTGCCKIGGKTYCFNSAENGRMVTGWAKSGDNKYYFGSDGAMRTGWTEIDGCTYCFRQDGRMLCDGSYKINGKVYTFGADGVLQGSGSSSDSVMLKEMSPESYMKYFDMTNDELMDSIPEDAEIFSEAGLIFFKPGIGCDDEFYQITLFLDETGGVLVYIAESDPDHVGFDDLKAVYDRAGWTIIGEEEGDILYRSPDGVTVNLYTDGDGTAVGIAVFRADCFKSSLT